ILARQDFAVWFDPVIPASALHELLCPCPEDWIVLHPVVTSVGNVRSAAPPTQSPSTERAAASRQRGTGAGGRRERRRAADRPWTRRLLSSGRAGMTFLFGYILTVRSLTSSPSITLSSGSPFRPVRACFTPVSCGVDPGEGNQKYSKAFALLRALIVLSS